MSPDKKDKDRLQNSQKPVILRSKQQLALWVARQKAKSQTIGLVPTMGALHEGHLSLVSKMNGHADKTIVSLFVNPKQFGEGEDFSAYPRTETSDISVLAEATVDSIYIPLADEIYPEGSDTTIDPGQIGKIFEGAERPGHFAGVATVVLKLFSQVQPDYAIFGEKDYQQLAVIKQITRDLDLPIEILSGPTIRDSDGLALSSRNRFLSENGRRIAGQLNKKLIQTINSIQSGSPINDAVHTAISELLSAGFKQIDYMCVVDPDSLAVMETFYKTARIITAARIDGVRLLDNMEIIKPR